MSASAKHEPRLASAPQEEFLRAAREQIRARIAAGETRGQYWANAMRWPTVMPPDLRDRLARLAVSCVALEDLELAVLFEKISERADPSHSDQTTIRLVGAEGRAVEIRACDQYLTLISASVLCSWTPSKDTDELTVTGGGRALLVAVETGPGEPNIEVPTAAGATDITIDLSSLPRLNVPIPLCYVPPTDCVIGADLLARNSLPACTIELGPLVVQKTPTTIEQFAALGGDVRCCRYLDQQLFDDEFQPRPSVLNARGVGDGPFPAVGLDLEDVERFVRQLPTPPKGTWGLLDDREWEALFRGPDEYVYPWGNHWIDGGANVLGSDVPALEPVGLRPLDVSRWGLRDGAGNTEEWTQPRAEPVAKGGSWYNDKQIGRCASRVVRAPDYRHPKLSFRLALRL
jgi:hypothetical protein